MPPSFKIAWLALISAHVMNLFAAASCVHSNACKNTEKSKDWPSLHAWAALNGTLGGRLLAPAPPGAVCHKSQPTYNSTECASVAKAWTTYEFHASNPISVMWDQFTNYTCLPDTKDPCSPAGYPSLVVNASSPEQVKVGVDFGKSNADICDVVIRLSALLIEIFIP